MNASVNNIMDSLMGDDNKNLRELILHNMKEIIGKQDDSNVTLSNLLSVDLSDSQKRNTYYALMLAKTQAENKQNYDLLETDYREIYDDAKKISNDKVISAVRKEMNEKYSDYRYSLTSGDLKGTAGNYAVLRGNSAQRISDAEAEKILRGKGYASLFEGGVSAKGFSMVNELSEALNTGTISDRMGVIEEILNTNR